MRRLLAVIGILLGVASAVVAADGAVILEQTGTVTVQAAGSANAGPAVTGRPLGVGDVVNTGSDGTARLLLSDGSRIDLFANSRLLVQGAASPSGGGIFGRLWRSITGKFSDSEYAGAQAGGVGAFRAPAGLEEMFNDYASEADLGDMRDLLAAIAAEDLPQSMAELLEAVVYEDYGQFIPAQAIYLDRIDRFPDDPVTYDMLIDLYLKMDLPEHASDVLDQKAAALSAATSTADPHPDSTDDPPDAER